MKKLVEAKYESRPKLSLKLRKLNKVSHVTGSPPPRPVSSESDSSSKPQTNHTHHSSEDSEFSCRRYWSKLRSKRPSDCYDAQSILRKTRSRSCSDSHSETTVENLQVWSHTRSKDTTIHDEAESATLPVACTTTPGMQSGPRKNRIQSRAWTSQTNSASLQEGGRNNMNGSVSEKRKFVNGRKPSTLKLKSQRKKRALRGPSSPANTSKSKTNCDLEVVGPSRETEKIVSKSPRTKQNKRCKSGGSDSNTEMAESKSKKVSCEEKIKEEKKREMFDVGCDTEHETSASSEQVYSGEDWLVNSSDECSKEKRTRRRSNDCTLVPTGEKRVEDEEWTLIKNSAFSTTEALERSSQERKRVSRKRAQSSQCSSPNDFNLRRSKRKWTKLSHMQPLMDEDNQIALAISASLEQGPHLLDQVHVPNNSDACNNKKKKLKRPRKRDLADPPPLLLTTSPEAKRRLLMRAEKMLTHKEEDSEDEVIPCTPAIRPSSLGVPAVANNKPSEVAAGEKEGERRDEGPVIVEGNGNVTEHEGSDAARLGIMEKNQVLVRPTSSSLGSMLNYKTMWQLSAYDEDERINEFYVEMLGDRISPKRPKLSCMQCSQVSKSKETPSPNTEQDHCREESIPPPATVADKVKGSQTGLVRDLQSLFRSGLFSDLSVLTADGGKLSAHSGMLCSRCPSMTPILTATEGRVLDLSAFSCEAVSKFLQFIYTAELLLPLEGDIKEELNTIAELWGIEELLHLVSGREVECLDNETGWTCFSPCLSDKDTECQATKNSENIPEKVFNKASAGDSSPIDATQEKQVAPSVSSVPPRIDAATQTAPLSTPCNGDVEKKERISETNCTVLSGKVSKKAFVDPPPPPVEHLSTAVLIVSDGADTALIQTTPLIGQDTETQTTPLIGQDMETQTTPLIGQDTETQTTPLIGQDMETQTTPLIGQDTETQTTPLIGQDTETQTTPLIGQDMETQTTPLSGQDKKIQTTPLIGQDMETQTTPLSGQDKKIQTNIVGIQDEETQTTPPSVQEMETQTIPLVGSQDVPAQTIVTCIRTRDMETQTTHPPDFCFEEGGLSHINDASSPSTDDTMPLFPEGDKTPPIIKAEHTPPINKADSSSHSSPGPLSPMDTSCVCLSSETPPHSSTDDHHSPANHESCIFSPSLISSPRQSPSPAHSREVTPLPLLTDTLKSPPSSIFETPIDNDYCANNSLLDHTPLTCKEVTPPISDPSPQMDVPPSSPNITSSAVERDASPISASSPLPNAISPELNTNSSVQKELSPLATDPPSNISSTPSPIGSPSCSQHPDSNSSEHQSTVSSSSPLVSHRCKLLEETPPPSDQLSVSPMTSCCLPKEDEVVYMKEDYCSPLNEGLLYNQEIEFADHSFSQSSAEDIRVVQAVPTTKSSQDEQGEEDTDDGLDVVSDKHLVTPVLNRTNKNVVNAEVSVAMEVSIVSEDIDLYLQQQRENATAETCPLFTPNEQRKAKELVSDDNITPMPGYKNMATPCLKEACSSFGVRPLPKSKMIAKLEEIYEYTHPLVDKDGNVICQTDKEKKGPRKLRNRGTACSPSGDRDKDHQLMESICKAIKHDEEMHQDIVLYKPLELTAIQQRLRALDVSVSRDKLADLLDKLCITFTVPRNRPGRTNH